MGVSITYPGDLPNLNDPATFNVRALAFLTWVTGSNPDQLLGALADMDARDFFSVQSSPTDTTTGRVLLNRAHGLGETSAAPNPASLDTVTAIGFYRYTSSSTGAPSSAGVVLHMTRLASANASGFLQIAFGIGSQVFVRHLTNTVGPEWSAWTEIFTKANILGTVSQSGGVPTGAVIERGDNANGRYVRFADGLQICTATLTSSAAADTVWTYPAAFAGVDGFAFAPAIGAPRIANPATSGVTNTTLTFNVWTITAARAANSVLITATGRWF